jgi:hypothetical protein
MSHFVQAAGALALALICVSACGPSNTGLSGPARDAFVQGAVGSCSTKQASDPNNRGVAADTITQYCTCYANEMADAISPDELQTISANPGQTQGMLQPRIEAASKTCRDKVLNRS